MSDHKDVVAAVAAVMADLGGIAKMTSEERRKKGLASSGESGVQYAYRGIDQIAAAVQPLLAKHGVVIVPNVTNSRVQEVIINNKPWSDTFVHVEWIIAGPNDTKLFASTEGQGRDNSDKGSNKAMTGAYKNLLLRLLCIGDPNDDTDGTTIEADDVKPSFPQKIVDLYDRVVATKGTPVADSLKAAAAENNKKLTIAALAEDEQWASLVAAIITNPQEVSNG